VLVVVVAVGGVAMSVVEKVDVVAVSDRFVSAVVAVLVIAMVLGGCVDVCQVALVVVAVVLVMCVSIVEVVGVIAMLDGNMAARLLMFVVVVGVDLVGNAHVTPVHV